MKRWAPIIPGKTRMWVCQNKSTCALATDQGPIFAPIMYHTKKEAIERANISLRGKNGDRWKWIPVRITA